MVIICICCVFFFKQKTAYDMRISDWSSDVCSSDLGAGRAADVAMAALLRHVGALDDQGWTALGDTPARPTLKNVRGTAVGAIRTAGLGPGDAGDRKNGASGKSVAGRVALGGRRIMQKKKPHTQQDI